MSWSSVTESFLGRCALAVAVLAVSFVLLPLIAVAVPALSGGVGRWFFYWPQYALLPGGLRTAAGRMAGSIGVASIGASLFWLAAIVVFVAATRAWRARTVLLTLLPGALMLTAGMLALLASVGLMPVLDGP